MFLVGIPVVAVRTNSIIRGVNTKRYETLCHGSSVMINFSQWERIILINICRILTHVYILFALPCPSESQCNLLRTAVMAHVDKYHIYWDMRVIHYHIFLEVTQFSNFTWYEIVDINSTDIILTQSHLLIFIPLHPNTNSCGWEWNKFPDKRRRQILVSHYRNERYSIDMVIYACKY